MTTPNLAAYRRQRPRQIKLKLQHVEGFAAVDVQAALSDLLNSFDAPFAPGMRLNPDGTIALVQDGKVVEVITREQLNKRYLVHLITGMGEL